MGLELLFLLLPVAALSGWLVGRRRKSRGRKDDCPPVSPEYFQGLNYLLNEQQDEALEVFIRMSEADTEAVEIQFALAHLFLRRGEVDRAIRIHQNLIARPMLSREHRKRALYELALDYMRAGLLDRAETLFLELVDDSLYAELGRGQLLDIYQQEKEWQKAIEIARKLDSKGATSQVHLIAHLFCEMADEAISQGDMNSAARFIKQALKEDKGNVRASLLEAKLNEQSGNWGGAISAYKKVEKQDASYLPLVIEPLRQCYRQLDALSEYHDYLHYLCDSEESISLVLAYAQNLRERGDERRAVEILQDYLQHRPSLRALDFLLKLRNEHKLANESVDLATIRDVVKKLLDSKPVCRCGNCGFTSKSIHWQCPSCKRWGTVKPIQGIEGE